MAQRAARLKVKNEERYAELRKASRLKVKQRIAQIEEAMDAADIEVILGEMPDVKNPKRKKACLADLEMYLRTYHAGTFTRPFSQQHRRFIGQLQEACKESAWIVRSVFRGFGKTSLTEGAAEWAIVGGHKRFIPIIAASSEHADAIAAGIRGGFENNDMLLDDFPEICWPVRALEMRVQRCTGQRFRGKSTFLKWSGGFLQFPSNTGALCAGSIIATFGWTASFRGLKRRLPDGNTVRPDFVIVDDPQTDESAQSPTAVMKLLDTLIKSVLGLGGHNRRISVVVPATVIQPNDAIAQLMDPQEYPAWLAENIPMLKTLPKDTGKWLGEYARIRGDFDRSIPGEQRKAAYRSLQYYRAHRAELDEGAEATWKDCYERGFELSGVQHAMNLWIDKGEDYFWAECQGKPSARLGSGSLVTDVDYVAKKVNGLAQRTAPADCLVASGFIDVAHDKLQWMLCAFRSDFGGSVIDYGEWPEGNATLRGMEGTTLSGAVFRGLCHLVERMAAQAIPKSDGEGFWLQNVLVDCGDPGTRDAVFASARGQRFPCRVVASRGRAHHQFYMPDPKKKRCLQNSFIDIWKGLGPVVVHDACVWRERFQRSMMLPPREPGSIDVYGPSQARHRELALQLCSEKLIEKMSGTSGEMYKWSRTPGVRNHFLDCGVGCMVAATMEGLRYGQEVQAIVARQQGQQGGGSGQRKRRGGFKAIED
jgi:hypothetical protein